MHKSMTLDIVMATMTLLFTAAIVAIVAKKSSSPLTILLVIIGLFLRYASHKIPALHSLTMFKLTPEVVLFVFLPALIFESAFNLDARELMRNIVRHRRFWKRSYQPTVYLNLTADTVGIHGFHFGQTFWK